VPLRLLCTTDLHGHIWPFDYQRDCETSGRGLARVATNIRAARATALNTLLFDCGDLLQGTALADWAADPAQRCALHPMIAAMNALGYDAAALGNHDLNYGLSHLGRNLNDSGFPVVCCNLVRDLGARITDDTPLVAPWVALDRVMTDDAGQMRALKIGVIGTAPPQSAVWDAAVLRGGVSARDAVAAVRALVPDMRAAGCDLIIALSHAGLGTPHPSDMAEDTSIAIAGIDGVDVVLAGHSHRRLPGPDFATTPGADAATGHIAGKPAAMAGAFGSDLAVLDLMLTPGNDGWRITRSTVTLQPTADTPPDPMLLDATRAAHVATRARMAGIVGKTRTRLHTVLAMAGHAPALALIADAQAAFARTLIGDTPLDALPVVSAVAPFQLGGPNGPQGFIDIPEGPLLRRHMADLSPFPNRLCVLLATGADLRLWLERAVSAYQTLDPGTPDIRLLNPDVPAYACDEIHGVEYRIDLSRPALFDVRTGLSIAPHGAQGRVTMLTCDGRPVRAQDRFAVAANSYRASGGAGYDMIPSDTPRVHSNTTLHDILVDHVRRLATVGTQAPAPFAFEPLGATALIRTAPQASAALHGDPTRRLDWLGLDAEGYGTLRLHV